MALHTCMLCEAVCGLSVELEGGEVKSVRGDAADPFSKGHLCPKAAAIPDIQRDPDRIREPQRRVGSDWSPVSWKEALGEAGRRIAEIQRRHGRSSVAIYLGNPSAHSYSGLLAVPLFSRLLGTRSRFSATSVDQLPQMLAALQMFGHQLLLPIPDLDRTQLFLVLGANPLASNGSLMTAPGFKQRFAALRARGGRLVVVDPRRTETAAVADQHLAIRPGSDAYLLLAILNVLFADNRVDLQHLAAFTDGLPALREAARRFAPERVAARTGLTAEAIRTLARAFAAAPSAVAYGRVGTCTQEFGALASWLVYALNAATGNLDRAGGAMFTTPAADIVGLSGRLGDRGHFGVWKSRLRGLPEFGGELPSAALAEEIDTPGEGQIKALITYAGNPVLSTPNGRRLSRALAGLEYMVSIDLYRNETTRHANLILPTRFGFERDHYDLIFYTFAVRNAARYVPAIQAAPKGVRSDFAVLLDLALAVQSNGGGRPGRKLSLALRAARLVGPKRILDLLLRFGPHGKRPGGMSVSRLLAEPHGIDLGPMEPRLPDRLMTKGKRLNLAPALFLTDLQRLEARLQEAPAGESLELIGRRQLRSNNSWMHNSLRLVKGPAACTLQMNPADAAARDLLHGQEVEVRSRTGSVRAPLAITSDLPRGVVCLPHGWGHSGEGTQLQIASAHGGVSFNDLTDGADIDALSGNANLSGVEVTVRRAEAEYRLNREPHQERADLLPI